MGLVPRGDPGQGRDTHVTLPYEPDYQVPPSGQDSPVSCTGLTDGEPI